MDKNFIKRALHVTSFNLSASDFESTTYKNEIQYIFNMHFFPKFDLSHTINGVDMNKMNSIINKLKSEDSAMFAKMHNYNLKGVGPGEVTLYFLVNSAHLGGGSSAGVDLVASNGKFEVKAVKVGRDGYASDFKLGGTAPLSDIIIALDNIRTKYKLGGTRTEMSGAIMDQMKKLAPDTFAAAQDKFASVAADYFKGHKVIFINNSPSNLGKIEAIKEVKKADVIIERVTSGTIKPKVKL